MLIEDDEPFAVAFCEYLEAHRFGVTRFATADNLRTRLAVHRPDLLVLDQFLVNIDSLTILQDIRAQFAGGIVILSGNPDHHDRVVALELGADDFISKSQQPREILARLRAVARRFVGRTTVESVSQTMPPASDHVTMLPPASSPPQSPPWDINNRRRELHAPGGKLVRLTAMEFEVLAYLAARSGETVSRDELSTAVLRREFAPLDRSLDNLVTRVRVALKPFLGTKVPIKSIRGVGYVFVGFVEHQ